MIFLEIAAEIPNGKEFTEWTFADENNAKIFFVDNAIFDALSTKNNNI